MPEVGVHQGAIVEVARTMSSDLESVARELSEMIHAQISELDHDLRPATHESCRANLGAIMVMLSEGSRPGLATATGSYSMSSRKYGLA